jgi:hypothetical protein
LRFNPPIKATISARMSDLRLVMSVGDFALLPKPGTEVAIVEMYGIEDRLIRLDCQRTYGIERVDLPALPADGEATTLTPTELTNLRALHGAQRKAVRKYKAPETGSVTFTEPTAPATGVAAAPAQSASRVLMPRPNSRRRRTQTAPRVDRKTMGVPLQLRQNHAPRPTRHSSP